jgi:ketosteroid isomerase-like protein
VGPNETEVTAILEQIRTDSQDTIHTLRDTVWALNPDNDAPQKLLERMRAVGFQLLTLCDIQLTFECTVVPDELPSFSMEQRRNIYFVYKEALHNIVKHAHATAVEVLVCRQSDELRIRISDNGNGFEKNYTGDGNGLTNFQKRAREGGFSVTVSSEWGQGIVVELLIPIHQTTTIGDGPAYQEAIDLATTSQIPKPSPMKTLVFLAFVLSSPSTFAQTKVADEYTAMMQARNTDAVSFFQTRTTPDLTFITGHDGTVQNKEWLMGLLKGQKSHKADITNLKIQQAGDLAVATGISTITAVSLDGAKTGTYKDAFTYIMRWIEGKWMFTNLHHTRIEYK